MNFFIIIVVNTIFSLILKFVFDYKVEKIKKLKNVKELDDIVKKYPGNIEVCKKCLKLLKNNDVKIEENRNSTVSLYMVITDKISIANISDTYTRLQTIAHECIHSVQNRKLLMFNFIYSNIYLISFIIMCIIIITNKEIDKMLIINIFLVMSLIYYMIRMLLENDAMIKARYLTKEYMESEKISTKSEIEKTINGFDQINEIGIKMVNYNTYIGIIIRLLILDIVSIIF